LNISNFMTTRVLLCNNTYLTSFYYFARCAMWKTPGIVENYARSPQIITVFNVVFQPIPPFLKDLIKKAQGALLLLGLRVRLRTLLSGINRVQRFDDQSDSRRIHGTLDFLYGTAGNVLIGVSYARVHSRHVFDQLGKVLELDSSAGQHNAGDQLLFKTQTFTLVIHKFNVLCHAGLSDVGQVPDGNLWGLQDAETGDG